MFFLFLFLSIIYPLKGGVSLKKYYFIGPVGKIDEAGRLCPLEMLRQTFCYRREKEIPYLINISLSLSIKTILF